MAFPSSAQTAEEILDKLFPKKEPGRPPEKDKLIKALEEAVADEDRAAEEYHRLADELDKIGKHVDAIKLRGIASDEYRHRETLREILLYLKR